MTERTKTVPLTLPEAVWGRLASRADNDGTTVAELVAKAVSDLVPDLELVAPPLYPEGYTGEPGHRLAVLAAEVSKAHRSGRIRSSELKRSLRVAS